MITFVQHFFVSVCCFARMVPRRERAGARGGCTRAILHARQLCVCRCLRPHQLLALPPFPREPF